MTGTSKWPAIAIAAATSAASRGNATSSGSRVHARVARVQVVRLVGANGAAKLGAQRRGKVAAGFRTPSGVLADFDRQESSLEGSTTMRWRVLPQTVGRHFLQIPGPTNVPDRVLRAIDAPTIDHRGPAFAELGREVLDGMAEVFRTDGPVVIYPSSGTGARRRRVNTLSPGDRVLAFETGHFATLAAMAERLGLEVDWVEGDWRHGVDPDRAAVLRSDPSIAAVMVVHNETSTAGHQPRLRGARGDRRRVRRPVAGRHDLLAGSIDYRHDEWGVDVTVGCSQKGLMLPPGSASTRSARRRWPLRAGAAAALVLTGSRSSRPTARVTGRTRRPPTCSTGCARRSRCRARRGSRTCSSATSGTRRRRARRCAWGLEVLCLDEREHSAALTAVRGRERRRDPARDPRALRHVARRRAGKVAGRVFRIGHLGDFNDLMLAGTLCGVEMGLRLTGVPVADSGVEAALALLEREPVAV